MNVFKDDEEPLDIVETRQVKRITIKNVLVNFLESFSLERGGIHTIKSLLVKPGETVRDYLGPNRYHYTPPFRILVVSTALVLYFISLSSSVEGFEQSFSSGFNQGAEETNSGKEAAEFIQIMQNYFNLLLWSLIPFMALFSFLLNRKKRYNYAEHLVLQTYLFCITNIITFLILADHLLPQLVVITVVGIGSLLYFVFGYKQFTQRSWPRSTFDSVVIYIGASFLWTAALGILVLAAGLISTLLQ
jgi:hypothetical protein